MSIRALFRRKITWLAAAVALLAPGLFLLSRRAAPPEIPAPRLAVAAGKPAVIPAAAPDWTARIAAAAPADFPSLAEQILAQSPSAERDRALAALISAWIKRHPEGLRAFIDTLDVEDGLGGEFFAALASALPYVSDDAASSPYLSELVSQLVDARAEEDPTAALAWAEKWLLDDALEKIRVTVAGVLAESSPAEALRQLDKIKNPLRRIQALNAISEGYAENDPQAARAWAEQLPIDAEVAAAMNGVLRVMAGDDPSSAGEAFQAVHARIAEKYAQLVAADRRSRGLPETPPFDEQGNPIVEDAGGEDALPRESPDLDLLADASQTIARELALGDPAAALNWSASLPGVLQPASRRAALTAWAESDPVAAYQYTVANRWNDADTYAGIFESWGALDPAAAAAAATGVAGDRLRGAAISSVVGAWVEQVKDPAAVGEWIARLPRESDRNAANRALASAVDADQPQLAWDRVLQISNPDDRREVLSSAFASLVANQPRLASAALGRAGNLTPEERRMLSRMLDPKLR